MLVSVVYITGKIPWVRSCALGSYKGKVLPYIAKYFWIVYFSEMDTEEIIRSPPTVLQQAQVSMQLLRRLSQYLEGAMGPPFTNLFASCCTSPSFVFGARFATPRMALGPMCHVMCWLLFVGFAALLC